MTFLKSNQTETVKAYICDELCKHLVDDSLNQDEVDEKCRLCKVNQIKQIVME